MIEFACKRLTTAASRLKNGSRPRLALWAPMTLSRTYCKQDHASSYPKLPEGPQLEDASAMFRALGDPSRLRLLARLASGEVCVTQLAELEDEKLSTVSARLQTLHAVRLVKRRREAKHIFYALSDDHVLHLVQSAIEHAAERR